MSEEQIKMEQGVYRMKYDGRVFVAIVLDAEEMAFMAPYIIEKISDEVEPYRQLFSV